MPTKQATPKREMFHSPRLIEKPIARPERAKGNVLDFSHCKLQIHTVNALTYEQIADLFHHARWPDGEYCPRCGCVELYTCKSSSPFRCKRCAYKFSVTSGTLLASGKITQRQMLLLIVFFLYGARGTSAHNISKTLGVCYKPAFAFCHKLREAIAREQDAIPPLTGDVEIDGAVFGGYIERFNFVNPNTGKIACRRRHGNRKTVVVAHQRGGRRITTVVTKESEALPFIKARVREGAVIHADMARGWDSLKKLFQLMRVSHSVEFSNSNSCTNNAEGFWSQLRAKQRGIHGRMSGVHLQLYAAEMAWRMDNKQKKPNELALDLLRMMLTPQAKSKFVGYTTTRRKQPKAIEPKRASRVA